MPKAMNVGLVGCGMIRKQYLKACGESALLNLVGCADLVAERERETCAEVQEQGWGTPEPCTFEELLERDEIQLIMNITNPKAHYPLNVRALTAGKHVYSEKPLAVTNEEGRELLAAAEANGVRIGCAPDTFLGAGHQTTRKLLDDGLIGEPTAASLFFVGGGPDGYHEDPEFFFEKGAGPLQDNGVYALTMGVTLLGPVARVMAMTKKTWDERKVLSKKKYGQPIPVEVPTHIAATLEFANGVIATFMNSFDIRGQHHLPHGEIYGTEGTLVLPNPNTFDNKPSMRQTANPDAGWQEMELTCGHAGTSRGVGAADIVAAVAHDRPHRASGELAYQVLEISNAIYRSGETGRAVDVESTLERPLPFADGLIADIRD